MKHVKIFEDFVNESFVSETVISDPEVEKKLEDKSKSSGIPIEILRTLMRRGMKKYHGAKSSSNRWNATEKEYGFARVDSFIHKDKSTWGSVDSDLAKKLDENEYHHVINGSDLNKAEINEGAYPRSKGGPADSSLKSEEIGRVNLKHKGEIIGTLLVSMRPAYNFRENTHDESSWEVEATFTAYSLDNSSSNGSNIWSAPHRSLPKEEAIKAGKEFLKNVTKDFKLLF